MADSSGCNMACLIVMGLIPLILSVSLTNSYIQKYEPEDTNLAEVGGRWLIGVIVFGLFALCSCTSCAAEIFMAGAVCLGICITLMSIVGGILISISASKSESSEGKAVGAIAAVFTFFVVCTPWCILASCAVRGSSSGSGSTSYRPPSPRSPRAASADSSILDKMSDEDKRKFLLVAVHYKENELTGDDLKTLTEIQQKYA